MVLALVDEAAQQLANFLLLPVLRVDPIADHLLFVAHVADQRLDALGEIGHRGRAAPVIAGIGDFGRGRRSLGLDVARQKVLELGIEAVLRLARLKVEEAENQASRRGRTATK